MASHYRFLSSILNYSGIAGLIIGYYQEKPSFEILVYVIISGIYANTYLILSHLERKKCQLK